MPSRRGDTTEVEAFLRDHPLPRHSRCGCAPRPGRRARSRRARLPRLERHRLSAIPDGGYVCAILPDGEEVRLLFEHGARLDDRDGLLEGDGVQTRHLTMRARDPALAAAIGRLVRDAVAERLFRR